MSIVNITHVQVLDNPSPFTHPFQFEITFECIAPLQDDLEWKIIYVGSAESEKYDQVLDCIMVGPVPVGVNKFIFQADAPRIDLIPVEDIIGVTVVLITCSYFGKEFVRVGYYVNNDYLEEELRENPPMQANIEKLYRNILVEKPRVTRFPINWDNPLATITEQHVEISTIANGSMIINNSDQRPSFSSSATLTGFQHEQGQSFQLSSISLLAERQPSAILETQDGF